MELLLYCAEIIVEVDILELNTYIYTFCENIIYIYIYIENIICVWHVYLWLFVLGEIELSRQGLIDKVKDIFVQAFGKRALNTGKVCSLFFFVNTAQKIIISTIGCASGKHGMALPYKGMMDGTSEYCMEGLPAGLKLRKPKDYGSTQLKNIISFENSIKVVYDYWISLHA